MPDFASIVKSPRCESDTSTLIKKNSSLIYVIKEMVNAIAVRLSSYVLGRFAVNTPFFGT